MNLFYKTTLIIALTLVGLVLVVAAFLANPKNFASVFAEEYVSGRLICDEPIPVGQAIEETTDLVNDIYVELQRAGKTLEMASGELTKVVAKLSAGGNEICDYSQCKPKVIDIGAKIGVEFKMPWGSQKPLLSLNIPVCQAKDCEGNPCPDLTNIPGILREQREKIEGVYSNIHKYITTPSVLVTEDIKDPAKNDKGQEITRPEAIKRRTQVVREWLSPSSETGKQTCALSDLERKRAEAGTAGNRFPMRCADALKESLYWPKVWSEKCANECKDYEDWEQAKFGSPCAICLGDTARDTDSALSKINAVIYGWTTGIVKKNICGAECVGKALDEKCAKCLNRAANNIVGKPSRTDEENFTTWICGGYYNNYACCHETQRKIEE